MTIPFEELLKVMIGECYARRNAIFTLFVLISLTLLAIGSVWPKRYTSFAIIHVDSSNIIQPLMNGAAVTTRTDHAKNATEIISGEVIMNQVLKSAGWLKTNPSEVEKEKIKEEIKKKMQVNSLGDNLLKIEYRDDKPMRAYITAKKMANLFIYEGERARIEESEAAYNFIEKQVNEYLSKLTRVENSLREFRSNNPDARPGLQNEVSMRISSLKRDIEQTRLQLRETLIRKNSLKAQLSGEAAITISQSKEGQYRSKIADLQARLETLRLDYKDTYPDIVRLKHQIDDLKESMTREVQRQVEARNKAKSAGGTYIDEAIILNPLYQQLRGDASSTETKIATLNARISEMKKMLGNEYERAKRIHGGEATLIKLTRDYDVNQGIYQDLLKRLENARVSKNLGKEQQGLTFKIQEPAKVPLLPTGVRFIHFAVAGVVLGLAVPFGLIYIMLQIDPRIRFSKIIIADLELPVLADINLLTSHSEEHKAKINTILLSIGTLMVILIYAYVGWLKFKGQL
jgi:protein tyrosine kinase modulator